MRQARKYGFSSDYDPKPGVSIATLAYEYPAGFNVPEHCHGSDQLIYAIRGVMHIAAGRRLWLIPPHFAIWIPAYTAHYIRMPGPVSMRTLYLRPGLASRAPRDCTALQVTPLLRELVVEAVRLGQLRCRNALHRALCDLIIAQLHCAAPVPHFVTLPKDHRALAVAQSFMANQRESGSFAVLCRRAGATPRTIQRAFQRDVGLSFRSWRRQFRLLKAIELLAEGSTVKEIAFQLGYQQPSAFVEAFRRTLGATPKSWAAALQKPG